MPDWLRTLRLAPGPGRAPVPRSSRRLWLTSALLLGAGALLMLLLGGADEDDPDRLADRSFARVADARCAATEATDRSRLEGQAEVRRIQRITANWEATVRELRTLPVAPEDERRVEAWLATWDRWIDLGHDYADALADGDVAEAQALFDEAEPPKRALSRFAAVNGMDHCIFGD
jgi:hypothetical protein